MAGQEIADAGLRDGQKAGCSSLSSAPAANDLAQFAGGLLFDILQPVLGDNVRIHLIA